MTDVKTIYDSIKAKSGEYQKLLNYYLGNQPTVYLTARLREVFQGVDATFTENWCSVVIDTCQDRISLTGFDSPSAEVKAKLAAAWERNTLAIEAADIHTEALICSECYAIVWPDANNLAEIFYNSPLLVHVVYSADNPRVINYAGKVFDGDDGKARMTLYYPDRLEYYIASKSLSEVSEASAFVLDDSQYATGQAPNPFGQVPVFQFKINRYGQSDLTNVIPLQNGVNKLMSDMAVAAEYGAFKQRYIISQSGTSGLKNAPNEIWDLPAGDGEGQQTSVGEFSATDLGNYLDAIDRLSGAIGIISRTPRHYFYAQGGDPSGEALIALEAPLNHKAQDRIDRFIPTWKELAAFVCKVERLAVSLSDITPVFEKPETIQPRTAAEITKIRVDSKVPLTTALRWEGKSEAELEVMDADKAEETAAATTSMASALLEAERKMKAEPMPTSPIERNGANE